MSRDKFIFFDGIDEGALLAKCPHLPNRLAIGSFAALASSKIHLQAGPFRRKIGPLFVWGE